MREGHWHHRMRSTNWQGHRLALTIEPEGGRYGWTRVDSLSPPPLTIRMWRPDALARDQAQPGDGRHVQGRGPPSLPQRVDQQLGKADQRRGHAGQISADQRRTSIRGW